MGVDWHNKIAPDVVNRLIREGQSESDTMVALESIVLGVMAFYRPAPRHAGEFLDTMTARVIDRLGEMDIGR
ncbi:hypothetical protein [Croceicoccus sp. BE223]|uniref:hypothetical protein n=1 Tax=Croceicoccus sp. BE223 TaxID=2817716 RepID=UPI002856BDF4|nr:hypothetical protein [Croceicoccus sp. BE223]MDR7101486.1 hypothetical protein [Croceicoccus sp. BE223]